MSLNKIFQLRRIFILSNLIAEHFERGNVIENIRLAKDLANVIDELNYSKIDFSKLAHGFMDFFPAHWKKRTQFLLIVNKYRDIDNSYCHEKRNSTIPHIALNSDSFKKISVSHCDNIYEEIDLIIRIIKQNLEKRISIISPNRDFSKYLIMRLYAEKIEYTSYCGNFNISPEFIEAIRDNFQNCSETELVQIAEELSDIDTSNTNDTKCNVSLLSPAKICKIPSNGVIIFTELNEASWKSANAGSFWLHHSLRKKLGLIQNENFIENLFYYGIEISKKAYLLWALRADGQNNQKSSILAKLEAIAEKRDIQLEILAHEDSNTCVLSNADLKKHIQFKLPNELSVWDIERLMRDPGEFYIRNILNLKPTIVDKKTSEIYYIFKKIAEYYFLEKSLNDLFSRLKDLDFFAYFKAQYLVKFLHKQKRNCNDKNHILGAMTISDINVKITGHADRIINYGNFSALISYQLSPNQSTREILYSGASIPLILSLIAENNGFPSVKKPIRNIQIWNLMAPDEKQIIAKEIEISEAIVEQFKERLYSGLLQYI